MDNPIPGTEFPQYMVPEYNIRAEISTILKQLES